MSIRADFAIIEKWIRPQSTILDLGCGDGALMEHLRETKQCSGYGVEINDQNVLACTRRGVNVIQQNLNNGLQLFANDSFETVIQLSTLQMIHGVETILSEIARVGHEAIVSFPNFGYWDHRWQLFLGRMPVSESLPYEWYDTPNIRCATMNDFEALANKLGLELIDRISLHQGKPVNFMPNLFGSLAIFRFRKQQHG
ncbi:methionine biosynthesis protein MetW [Ampullimonas aquatilis]|uniref:methionine biosynthesis protein MetW n=1 Tax=Ampullimonas aquatilis TaxID=1341549 RepID=UPI003C728B49